MSSHTTTTTTVETDNQTTADHDARVPVNRVRLADESLRTFVIDSCVLCGEEHRHGAEDPTVAAGGRSHRSAHCRDVDHSGGYYLELDPNAAPPRGWYLWLDVEPPADLDARPGTRAARETSAPSERREAPGERTHSTYEADHWDTVHVGEVDRLGAFESAPATDDRSDETIRVDLDGVGDAGASAHDPDANLQLSVCLTPETASTLARQLREQVSTPRAVADGGERE